MIRHIRGVVSYTSSTSIVIDVAGIGYLVHVANALSYKLDQTVKLHTYQAVQERALDLYGFSTLDELQVFQQLLTIPKVGPKSAAQILAQADIELIKTAVHSNDPLHLSKISGIGKKTAEKVVLGLKDAFADEVTTTYAHSDPSRHNLHTDTIDALISLGYPQTDARKAVQNLPESITSTTEAVTIALKDLGRA